MTDGPAPGTIAGDFWCAVYDEQRHRPQLPDDIAGMGLATGLLAELVISGHVDLYQEEAARGLGPAVLPRLDVEAPVEQAQRTVYGLLLANQSDQEIKDWIRFLARTAWDLVGERLVAQGLVEAREQRGLRRLLSGRPQQAVYLQVDSPAARNRMAWAGFRLARVLSYPPELLNGGYVDRSLMNDPLVGAVGDPSDVLRYLTCAGICAATGLIAKILSDDGEHATAKANLPGHMQRLPPAISLLLSCVDSVVGDAILTQR